MMKYLIIVIGLLFVGCNSGQNQWVRNQSVGAALGTSYTIIYIANASVDYQKEIDSVFNAVNQSLSTYIPSSDISKINKGDSTVVVDHMFKEVFQLSKTIYDNTNGYFDPTVGTLVNAWGFGPGEEITMDSTSVDSLLAFVGFEKVALSNDNRVKKEDARIYFDFNAIAKGYAIDRVAVMLSNKGITDFLIEVGGELVAKGINKTKGKPWLVGIDDPESTTTRGSKILLNLQDKALASSGNYRKFRIDEQTGEKYVHTVDPKTGYTKNSVTLGVNIIANNCATADAYATAFMAMDLEDAFKLIAKNRALEAYVIYLDETGETQEFLTNGFKELVVQQN
ncbi:FAD:protein FMN transferase [Maribacter sp. CXY002]|uniref:FAD:protein FMN transferase n=1 Tax=Maribacter luteocoastalis TaxID=3407671 RepID=UPI003B683F50